ncbi:MAG TPA: tetratricopeptide repeat protein [Methyloversatilis sp.]
MSLLLEALKKAEAAKRRDDESSADAPARPDAPPAAPAPAPRITPAHELELIDDEIAQAARFAGLDVPEPQPAPAPAPTPGAEAARVLFDVKRPPSRSRSPLPWLLGGSALVLLGIAGWVAWQIGLLENGQGVSPVAQRHHVPPAIPPVAPTAPATPANTLSAGTGAAVPGTGGSPSAPAVAAPVTPPSPPAESSRFLSGQAVPVAAAAAAPAPAAPATPPIRITRNAPAVPQDVADGFAAFNAGDMDHARVAYERALRADPRNPDALYGLAALAQARGDDAQATQLMRRIAEVDPGNAAALVTLNENSDPAVQEARLLNIAAAQPRSAPVALALGNLYASQARWREAQQAYFNAWTLAPDQPDHAYNLAVSLDQLRQPRLALQYYREALSLRGHHAAAFDAQAVTARIEALQVPDAH